ncbi:MAG: GIY-YIG nuclease family protein [Oscillospiraceae bacterium]
MAISGRHRRSERAIVKTVRTSVLSLRGAKRRGNLGKALPFGTSHRKTARTSDLSLRGAKRRGNLAVLARITESFGEFDPQKGSQSMKQYYVYLLTNKGNTVLYTGMTNDLQRRLYEHREGPEDGFYKAILCPKISLF